MKLKGFELPKLLPPSLAAPLSSPSAAVVQPMAPVYPQAVPMTVPIMTQVPVALAPFQQSVIPTIPLASAGMGKCRKMKSSYAVSV